ncbi:MAG: hypothetical protein JETT_0753 [Candidatus Jettenia ecosi]|uniref:Right handed beta helix domain-containing protein n=1 Tax=Candidatus Jettenia ecosi TaxID=2494326 RepID=A0A533QDZ1_9BACT|nr:MAG: hypothetical protein JETT_0753 [Candidatus Jettenia ecosi]
MSIFFILFIAIASLWCNYSLCKQDFAYGNSYYVDPNKGDDGKIGDLSAPWRTIKNSVSRLQPGDTLYLRGGTYYESQIKISNQGAKSKKIIIKNYPDELPIIDGGYAEFRVVPNSDWEIHDAKKNIYRSVKTYSSADYVYGYFGSDNNCRLISYESYHDLSAENEDYTAVGDVYLGSGIFWNSSNEKIYIRLKPSKQQMAMEYTTPLSNDPRLTKMSIFSHHEIIILSKKSSYIDIEGINLRYQNNAFEFKPGSNNILIKNSNVLGGRTHIYVNDNAHDLVFDGIEIEDSVPPWIAWTDVKRGKKPAHRFQGTAISIEGSAHDIEIKNCVFNNTWDGINATRSAFGLHIHDNVFKGTRDDVVQLGSGCSDVEINHNKMILVSKGISRHGSGSPPKPGTKYIHHNIIDCSKPMLGGRRDPSNLLLEKYQKYHGPNDDGMVWARPFGSHRSGGYGGGDPWKIYHNTIIFGKELNDRGAGHEYVLESFYPGYPQEVYNNIIIQTMDHWLARDCRVADGSQICDGNIYYRPVSNSKNYFFRSWAERLGGSSKDFKSLSAFKSSKLFDASRKYYAPGWEENGTEANPQLDKDYYPAPDSPAAHGAIPLPSSWPGQDGKKYRGALPPKNLNIK